MSTCTYVHTHVYLQCMNMHTHSHMCSSTHVHMHAHTSLTHTQKGGLWIRLMPIFILSIVLLCTQEHNMTDQTWQQLEAEGGQRTLSGSSSELQVRDRGALRAAVLFLEVSLCLVFSKHSKTFTMWQNQRPCFWLLEASIMFSRKIKCPLEDFQLITFFKKKKNDSLLRWFTR